LTRKRRIYALRPAPLQELEYGSRDTAHMGRQFQRLDALLDGMKASEKKHGRKKPHIKR